MTVEPTTRLSARIQAMLDVEAALADAEASTGVIPRTAAAPIRAAARADLFDHATLVAAAARAGNLAIPLVAQLTINVAAVDEAAARYVHWGATSQDIIDTALVLQLRSEVPAIVGELERAAESAARHARTHVATMMAGRTWLQHGPPTTFGAKAAGWLDALHRGISAVRAALERALVLQFGGATGTLAALGTDGPAVARALGERLDLPVPDIPWHTERDRLVTLACALGVATGTLGKIGRDLALLAQTEVGEAFEDVRDGGGSSTMPHKRNPVHAAVVIAAAVRAPGLVSTLLSAMSHEHERGLGVWQAEWESLPELVEVSASAARAVADALDGLTVDPRRMRANLDVTNGLYLSEAVSMKLAVHLGKADAHRRVEAAARLAAAESRSLASVLAEDAAVTSVLSEQAIREALTPDRYLGSTRAFVEQVLARWDTRAL